MKRKIFIFSIIFPVMLYYGMRFAPMIDFESAGEEALAKLALPFKMLQLAQKPHDEELLMPVDGKKVRQVADTWGAPRPGDRGHKGQDIFAPKGTPVRSATGGVVIRKGTMGIGGNAVMVMGAGGRRYYYAHLDSYGDVKAGDWVTPETVLGYVGNTGNAAMTPPHLHFGIYARGGAIDPLPLLRDRA